MTGYAIKEVSTAKAEISIEIKSVNSRFLDLRINLPPFLNQLEKTFYDLVSQKISRGKVDVTIRVQNIKDSEKISADIDTAKAYAEAIGKVASALGKSTDDIPLSLIISQEGVLSVEHIENVQEYQAFIEPVFTEVLDLFIADRRREGENLYLDLSDKIGKLDEAAAFFKEWQPKMEEKFREQLTSKFHELLGNEVDEQRIMTETAVMLVRYTINEEVVRLQSHLKALHVELDTNPTPGKKIDFLCQEINREINTIGSKNQFAEVGAMVVTAKDALENIREQAKNVE
jgi:uncharacterized protein (TIGR00255 family)